MPIKLYNTLTRKKEEFRPRKKGKANIYTCGPTVYWYQHIGNLRSYIFSDILKKVLSYNHFKTRQVMNVTDVGHLTSDADTGKDKIEEAARKEGKNAQEIADYYLNIFKKDLKKLNISKPDIWAKATDHIKEQIELIKKLEKKGFTYKTKDGLYFDTSKLKDYGKLARLNIKGLKAGKRISIREKKNKTDFALWKFSEKPGTRQQEWNSHWGVGFPGWHIECSAMSIKYLGEQFDIHTGGEDHISVHHTNEIAQSESATGKKPWVKYWLHGAFLVFRGEKVSKSKGGLYTLSQLEKQNFESLSYRYLCLNTHYKKRLEFSIKSLESAQNTFNKLKNIITELKTKKDSKGNTKEYREKFLNAINDDLNIPKALGIFWNALKDKNLGSRQKYELALEFDKIFGLSLKELKSQTPQTIPKEIQQLAEQRQKARAQKDFTASDKLRKKLQSLGYTIEDTKKGPFVKKI
ncbi:MAG: cysteine--tRNA ligase [Nanoarchaeota archaeon]|nr:cysteine--tRNA ligase [Nanoarchaeota archaeon]